MLAPSPLALSPGPPNSIPFPHPLTPTRAGVACRIKKAFAKSRCPPERCKIETVRPPPLRPFPFLSHHSSPLFTSRTSPFVRDFFFYFCYVPPRISDFPKIDPLASLLRKLSFNVIQSFSHFRCNIYNISLNNFNLIRDYIVKIKKNVIIFTELIKMFD